MRWACVCARVDSGTGYSSLSYLHRLPIDELKLDKSFRARSWPRAVRGASAHHTTSPAFGDSLALTVVAEGVETGAQHAFLAERDCAVVQERYLFSKPLAPEALERWIEASQSTAVRQTWGGGGGGGGGPPPPPLTGRPIEGAEAKPTQSNLFIIIRLTQNGKATMSKPEILAVPS